jgi:hypothetical protein
MQNAESILIIILAAVLIVFLVMAITALVLVIKLIRTTKRFVDRAEKMAETAGEAAEILRNASGPLAVFKLIRNIVKTFEKRSKKEG